MEENAHRPVFSRRGTKDLTTDYADGTDTQKANAGAPGARAGGVFAGPLTSQLADGPSKTPLHSLRE